MSKLFKMYGDLFMEVTPQPWLMQKSKTVKTRIAEGKAFCVNLRTGALTVYDPANVNENAPVNKESLKFAIKVKGIDTEYTLSTDIYTAVAQLKHLFKRYPTIGCVVYSNQEVTPVGYTEETTYSDFIARVKAMYQASHAKHNK